MPGYKGDDLIGLDGNIEKFRCPAGGRALSHAVPVVEQRYSRPVLGQQDRDLLTAFVNGADAESIAHEAARAVEFAAVQTIASGAPCQPGRDIGAERTAALRRCTREQVSVLDQTQIALPL